MYSSFHKVLFLFILIIIHNLSSYAQEKVTLQGKICDSYTKQAVAGASVKLFSNAGEIQNHTDNEGLFAIEIEKNDSKKTIIVTHPEYNDFTQIINSSNDFLHLHLRPKTITLHTMTVTAQSKHTLTETAISTISVNRHFFQRNNASTLSASLAKLPGIGSMNIGAGLSKPVIRGLGFNRIAVIDKGIMIQNQQWGADHGLELDQFDANRVIVSKGPMSLFYGSDAIGGVIEILPEEKTAYENKLWGDITAIGKSNNDLFGLSVGINAQSGNWFYRMRSTHLDYADFRIPTDTIDYMSWKIPVNHRRMKNTAGKEMNIAGTVMYQKNDFKTAIYISNNFAKTGLFPGSHGIPDVTRLNFDGSYRNIQLPYTTVNHFKVSSNSDFRVFTNWQMHADIGFQSNRRLELARFHTHFPNQSIPKKSPDIELDMELQTLSGNTRIHNVTNGRLEKTFGISAEYQINRVGGYSFLIPNFERFTSGVFGAINYKLTAQWTFIGGVRLDLARVHTHGFYDPILDEYLLSAGYDSHTAHAYAQRAEALKLHFFNVSGAAGVIFRPEEAHILKINFGRGFRLPSANELASNGVHHGAFRYEKGSPELKPETGFQCDIEYGYTSKRWRANFTPFINYFSNYIYLRPTGQWSLLPHTGQQYEYTQSEVLLSGGEIDMHFQAADFLQLSSNIEYAYTLNLDAGYALPFSPPTIWTSNAIFSAHGGKILPHFSVNVEVQKVFTQNRIAANEEKTSGVWLFGLSLFMNYKINKTTLITELQVQNIFNSFYLNHQSYYRKLNAPEPGRDIRILMKFPF